MVCVFLFYVKIFMQSTFPSAQTLSVLSSNDTEWSVGLRHPMKSIFKPEEDFNYFDKFMLLLT